MAENGEKEHPETAASTPASSHNEGRQDGGTKAPKDRSCPFCGQAFTSSSLGRHLDLYIKPKNPKPPDGVHDIDEIMKMRGGITRRQPKAGSKAAAAAAGSVNASGWHGTRSKDSTPQETPGTRNAPKKDMRASVGTPEESPRSVKDNMPCAMNSSHWMNTGIIPNLPPRAPSRNTTDGHATGQAQRMRDMRQDGSGHKTPRPEPDPETAESMWKLHEDAEVGRAAELALREVLSSIQAARQRSEPKQLFEDVDFMSLAFPGLCLAILPAPRTLFTPTPFPGGESWTLTPPGQKQYETLNRLVHARVKEIQNGDISRFPDSLHFKHSLHLQGAFEHWQNMSEADQASVWSLETLRAFAKAQDACVQAKQELEAANTRIRHLEQEFDRLSRCQLPREYLLHPPHTMPAPAAIVKDLSNAHFNSGAGAVDFDADALIDRWRTTVRATKPKRRPTVDTTTRAPDHGYHPDQQRPLQLVSDIMMNGSVWGVQGPFPRPGHEPNPSNTHVPPSVNYATPPNPGAVIDADDEDAEGEVDRFRQGDHGKRDSALVRRGDHAMADSDGDRYGRLNQNGKRPLPAFSSSGRAGGAKLYKAQVDVRDGGSGGG